MVRPGGPGWREALKAQIKPGLTITALEDSLLHQAKALGLPDEPDLRTFGELVGSIARMLGLPEKRQATTGQRQALMEAVLAKVDSGSWLAASAPHLGTATTLVERLSELEHAGLDAAGLANVAASAPQGLSKRLEDLAQVATQFEAGLANSNRDTLAKRMLACIASDSDAPFPFKDVVVLLGQAKPDPVAERFLTWLAARGSTLTIIAEQPDGGLFGRTERLLSRLQVAAEASAPGNDWYDGLFREPVQTQVPDAAFLAAPDVLTECEEVVRWCLQAVNDGVLPHRIGIFARSGESYGPLLLATAQRLGLPLAATISAPLLTSGFARLVLRTLQALVSTDVRDVGRLALSSYFVSEPDSRSDLWTLLRSCHATGDGWEALFQLPPADTKPWPWLAPLADWHSTYHAEEAKLADWVVRLHELVGETGLAESLAERHDMASRDQRALQVLQRSLADRAGHSAAPLSLRSYVWLCRRVWETEKVIVRVHDWRTESAGQNASFVSDTGSLDDYDALAVVGMVEGSLPRRRRDDPVLSDSDRRWINENVPGVFLESSEAAAEAERDEFVRVCASAARRLLFTYPASDDDRDNVPTLYLDEAKRCLGDVQELTVRKGHYAPSPSLCLSPADLAMRTCLDDPVPARQIPFLTSPAAMVIVQPVEGDEVSANEIAEAAACPFRAAVRHRLKIDPPYTRSSLGALVVVAERARLHAQPDMDTAVAAMQVELDRRLAELFPALESWEHSLLASAGRRFVAKWAEREFGIRSRQMEADPPDSPVRHLGGRLTASGRSTSFGLQVGDLGVINGSVPVARVYSSRSVGDNARADDPSIDLLVRLAAMALAVGRGRAALEFDTLDEDRVVFTVGDVVGKRFVGGGGIKKYPLDDLVSGAVRDPFADWCDRVKSTARDALAQVLAGQMRPRPGRYCERCGYADLCRSAKGQDATEGGWASSN